MFCTSTFTASKGALGSCAAKNPMNSPSIRAAAYASRTPE
jgi:hypothetical protein